MKKRPAISLLELLVIMSAATVVLTLTGVLLQRAMREQMLSRARVNAENASLRLADQFRQDVRNAHEIHPDKSQAPGGDFLKIVGEDERVITYSRKNGSVFRAESGGTLPSRHEQYAFPPGIELTINQLESPPRVSLTIQLLPNRQPVKLEESIRGISVPVSVHIEPVIGRGSHFPAAANAEVQP